MCPALETTENTSRFRFRQINLRIFILSLRIAVHRKYTTPPDLWMSPQEDQIVTEISRVKWNKAEGGYYESALNRVHITRVLHSGHKRFSRAPTCGKSYITTFRRAKREGGNPSHEHAVSRRMIPTRTAQTSCGKKAMRLRNPMGWNMACTLAVGTRKEEAADGQHIVPSSLYDEHHNALDIEGPILSVSATNNHVFYGSNSVWRFKRRTPSKAGANALLACQECRGKLSSGVLVPVYHLGNLNSIRNCLLLPLYHMNFHID
ncbi:hypothetical protein GOBAR_AA13520 [Gossypium barbadense]|uniref:Uncharacterized protein n=1 Tax=Gossypium barbadense TaxID=3634 RepID=A0A2P5XUV0_GOSBA|nr:hypothetical protein GOBAR_AA13520 [Gossypium barbadense]